MVTDAEGRAFRDVLGHYPTGVVLVTAIDDTGAPVGMVVGSFSSVSLDPPLVAYLPMRSSHSYGRIATAERFCVNVLSAEQEQLCRHFASRIEDKWSGVEWSLSPGGAPILTDALAWIECSTESVTDAGDHLLVMGRVENLAVLNPVAPLLFFQGGYGKFTISSVIAGSAPDLVHATRLAEAAREDIDLLATRSGAAVDVIAAVGADLVYVGASTPADVAPSRPLLGTRIPLMAPLGEQYVAWQGEDAAERWITRSGITDAEVRDGLLTRLRLARERGWSMSSIGADDEMAFYEDLREYCDSDITPARERNLRAKIQAWSTVYEPPKIDVAGEYDVHSLVAPVLDASGKPRLVVRLVNLPRPATGAQILGWVSDLSTTTQALGAKLPVSK